MNTIDKVLLTIVMLGLFTMSIVGIYISTRGDQNLGIKIEEVMKEHESKFFHIDRGDYNDFKARNRPLEAM